MKEDASAFTKLPDGVYISRACTRADLREILGNPTPLGVMGFILSLTPLACDLMEWRGAGGFGAATIGTAYFFGGLLLLLAAVLEFILGNTFVFVVFSSYGAFWLSLAATLTPFYAAYTAYDPASPQNPGFNNSYAFFEVFMGLLCCIYLVCSIRTNLCFMMIFLSLTIGFCLLAATSWQLANGNANLARSIKKVSLVIVFDFAIILAVISRVNMGTKLTELFGGAQAGGAFLFIGAMAGWYFLLVQMLASVDFPWTLPVGNFSRAVKGASERKTKDV
ncbi:GPR1/FUN34/yaaH family-domain-containing protein [Aspergillus arachidicola]|uniref:GPR1/FUN34/yaaH family-domain-containing protein n=1 Tax=Aspergillus arachidicola TaxID=656916 RepID=A0A5N6XSN2_9EURO|nr:GPR1/FUN34/yaaH family-domain-containing protein [Aspergillus arachidicola]